MSYFFFFSLLDSQLKILQLRKRCESALGQQFDLRAFHNVVLDHFGPLEILEKGVDEFITLMKTKTSSVA
jgi:uncharacterized protein (DUF885 family)